MPSKHPSEYTQAEVNVWLNSVGLGSKISVFQENAIDGAMLVTLSDADLMGDLGLSNLQARKFSQSLDFAKSLAEGGGGGGADAISLQQENAKLREEVSNLKAINKELQDQLMPPAPAPAPQAYAPAPQAHAPTPAPQRHGAPVMTGAAGGALVRLTTTNSDGLRLKVVLLTISIFLLC